jgi:hypothetical protein
LAAIVLNPKTPQRVSSPLTPFLLWRHLADVATSHRVPPPVRLRAESVLKERLPDLRMGERITLARLATPPVLILLLSDADRRVLESCLINPRLREGDLVGRLRRPDTPVALLEAAAASYRWNDSYAVRRELVLVPRCPLALALGQLSSLTKADLVRVAETPALRPLVRAAARRVAEALPDGGGGTRPGGARRRG